MPDAFRVTTTTCAFTVKGSNRFAHLYHKQDSLLATVYLHGEEPELIPQLSDSARFQLREKMGSKWAEESPTLIHILVGASESVLAERLLTYSLPFAGKKSRLKTPSPALNDVIIVDGKIGTVLSSRYERSKILRTRCLAHFGYQCQGCRIKLADRYGSIAELLIHVHHIERLADTGPRIIDPITDLIPLCPKCHAVVPLKNPPFTLNDGCIECVLSGGGITTLDGTSIALTRYDNDVDMLANKNHRGQVLHVPRWSPLIAVTIST